MAAQRILAEEERTITSVRSNLARRLPPIPSVHTRNCKALIDPAADSSHPKIQSDERAGRHGRFLVAWRGVGEAVECSQLAGSCEHRATAIGKHSLHLSFHLFLVPPIPK
jgi:hypothetical protein